MVPQDPAYPGTEQVAIFYDETAAGTVPKGGTSQCLEADPDRNPRRRQTSKQTSRVQ